MSWCGGVQYFLGVFAALVVFVVIGGIAVFNNTKINNKFSEWWCKYSEASIKGQKKFDCCGYECPADRPAGGSCPDGSFPPQSVFCNGTDVQGNAATFGKELCKSAGEEFNGYKGCKEKGLEELKSRFFPLFALAFAVGVLLLLGLFISGYLLCRRTRGGGIPRRGRGFKEGALLNRADPGRDLLRPGAVERSGAALAPAGGPMGTMPSQQRASQMVRPPTPAAAGAGGAREHK